MVGKYLLVTINRKDANDVVVSTKERHGVVLRFSHSDGLVISQKDGSEYSLPPLLDCYHRNENNNHLITSSEEAKTPDYVATFYVSNT